MVWNVTPASSVSTLLPAAAGSATTGSSCHGADCVLAIQCTGGVPPACGAVTQEVSSSVKPPKPVSNAVFIVISVMGNSQVPPANARLF